MRDDTTVLLAGIMHNVNNYLQTIIGNATLGMKSFPEYGMNHHFRVILTAADKCSETIKQMMALMISGKRDAGPVDVRAVVSEVIDIFEPVAENIIRISCSSEDVPRVFGNESDLSQILLNLLFNARDAIDENGEIVFSIYNANRTMQFLDDANKPGDYVCISVKDNGPGIPKSIQNKLFTEVGSTKQDMAHQGVGLVVSQFLAERHGGWIECAHTDDTGTEFILYFQTYSDVSIDNKEFAVS